MSLLATFSATVKISWAVYSEKRINWKKIFGYFYCNVCDIQFFSSRLLATQSGTPAALLQLLVYTVPEIIVQCTLNSLVIQHWKVTRMFKKKKKKKSRGTMHQLAGLFFLCSIELWYWSPVSVLHYVFIEVNVWWAFLQVKLHWKFHSLLCAILEVKD